MRGVPKIFRFSSLSFHPAIFNARFFFLLFDRLRSFTLCNQRTIAMASINTCTFYTVKVRIKEDRIYNNTFK